MNVYCILSDDRAYRSRSPALFSAIMKRHGIKGAYVPFAVKPENIGHALNSIKTLNLAGANVTVPYKEKVIPYLDALSEGANIIGAVNTVVRKGEILKGYNTNAIGVMDALEAAGFDTEGKSALVIGTGGAAKAVVFILNWLRTGRLTVAGRDENKAKAIVQRFGGQAISIHALADIQLHPHLVVNATSISDPGASLELAQIVSRLQLPECRLIMDLNYGFADNIWEETAKRNQTEFIDGILPLAHQARRTFALWTGLQIPASDFMQIAREL